MKGGKVSRWEVVDCTHSLREEELEAAGRPAPHEDKTWEPLPPQVLLQEQSNEPHRDPCAAESPETKSIEQLRNGEL
jgi:hypothetical protein